MSDLQKSVDIAVTGATGQLANRCLMHIADRMAPGRKLVAITRHPDRIATEVKRRATVRHGDFGDPASLEAAFGDVATLLLVSIEGPDDERLRLHLNAIAAAKRAGVRRIVYTSFFDVDPASPSMVAKVHRETEDCLQASGCEWVMLRNGPYIDNFVRRAVDAAHHDGVLRLAAGDARLPFIGRDDLAEAAACAVLNSAPNTAYRLSGPELLSCADVAAMVSTLIGKPLAFRAVDEAEQTAELQRQALHPLLIERRNAYTRAMRQGFMTALTEDFRALVGRPPRRAAEMIHTIDLTAPAH